MTVIDNRDGREVAIETVYLLLPEARLNILHTQLDLLRINVLVKQGLIFHTSFEHLLINRSNFSQYLYESFLY